ncbi:MAG: hypothetical protein M3N33_01565 [Actinomycetota bacterium]|nr:hypothetical protein [Actinomycetota bacterium]
MTAWLAEPLPTAGVTANRRVLVTDDGGGQSRSAIAAVRALSDSSYEPAVAASSPGSLAAASRRTRRVITVPPPDGPGYASAIRSALGEGGYLAALPSSDAALLALGAPVGHLLDKTALATSAEAAGFRPLASRCYPSADALMAHAGLLDYPLVVKPVFSRFPARKAAGPPDISNLPQGAGPLLVQPWIEDPIRAVAGVVWGGALVAVAHQRYLRTWPPECGTSSAAETVAPDLEVEEKLLTLLVGYTGIFQAQFAGDFLLDLNPRVYGSLPLAVASGVNLPAILCGLLRGETAALRRARPGVAYRWLEGDLRHIIVGVRSRRLSVAAAASALRPRSHTAHSVFSLRDPGPQLARLRHILASAGR